MSLVRFATAEALFETFPELSQKISAEPSEQFPTEFLQTLVAAGKLEVDAQPRVIEAVARVITDELMVEDRLNEEVREVLLQHASEMERSNVAYTEMFKMLKKKMAREKGIVL